MGLYDGYRLSNSTAIPQYVGSALPELTGLYDMAQKQYDAASSLEQTTANSVQQTPTLNQDAKTLAAINQDVQNTVRKHREQNNYEDLFPSVQQKAMEVAPKLKALSDQVRAQQAYNQSLEEKELGLDLWTKNALKTRSADSYEGIKFDGFGRPIGGFQGIAPAKNIDVDKAIRDNLSILTATSSENIRRGDNGYQRWDNRDGWQQITPEKVKQAYYNGKANDLDWQARDKQQVELRSYMATRGLTDDAAKAIIDGSNITEAKELMAQGYSPKQAYSVYHANRTAANIEQTQLDYALAKTYRQETHQRDSGISSLAEYQAKKNMDKADEAPYIAEGVNIQLTDAEKDPSKVVNKNLELTKNKADLLTEKERYENQLNTKGLSGPEKAQLQVNIARANDKIAQVTAELNRNNDILNYSKNKTAQEMGYGNLQQMQQESATKLIPLVSKQFPMGAVVDNSGKRVSNEQIAKAISAGRVNLQQETVGTPYSGGRSTTVTRGAIIDLGNGKTAVITNPTTAEKFNTAITQYRQDKTFRQGEFQQKFQETHTKNVENYSLHSETITLDDKQKKKINDMLTGSRGNIEISLPGQFDNLSENDRPKNLRTVGLRPQGIGKQNIFVVEELDEKGNPTGKTFDAKVNSTAARQIAQEIETNTKDPEIRAAASAMKPRSGARQINTMQVGDSENWGQIRGRSGQLHNTKFQVMSAPDGTISYELYDEQTGERLKSTKSPITAGGWRDQLTQNK